MEETILTVDQVAHIIQVHPFTVLKFIKQGRLKAAKLGRVYRIKRSDVDAFLEELTHQSVAPKQKKGVKTVEKKISVEIKDISKASREKEKPRQIDDDHYIIDFTT
jgi:excisionase family DNA binding protein